MRIKMTSGDEYYGKYQKVTGIKRTKYDNPRYYWKVWCMIIVALPCFIILCMNTYLLHQTQKDYEAIKIRLKLTNALIDETHSMIKTAVRPQVDVLMSFLSYQLPTSILNAFKKSNNELMTVLGDVTIDLSNLIDMYRSILGFDDDWLLMPETRHITCSFVEGQDVKETLERMTNAREKYHKYTHSPHPNPLDKERENQTQNPRLHLTPTPMSNHIPLKRDTYSLFQSILNNIQNYLPTNSTYESLISSLRGRHHDMANGNTTGDPGSIAPMPTPAPLQNDGHQTVRNNHRRRRYAVQIAQTTSTGYPYEKFRHKKDYKSNLHPKMVNVGGMCNIAKKKLDLEKPTCYAAFSVLEYIRCILL